jgi:hypothetical protein
MRFLTPVLSCVALYLSLAASAQAQLMDEIVVTAARD